MDMGDGNSEYNGDLLGTVVTAKVGEAMVGVADVGMVVGENVGGAATTKLFFLTSEGPTPVTASEVTPADLACFLSVCVKFFGEKACDEATMFPSKSASGVSWKLTMFIRVTKSIETGVLPASPLK